MSCSSGPEVANNGLVFSFDMNNIQKSWKGKPTTNFIANPTEEMARGEFGQYRDLAPIFNTNGLVPYSLSMDIKVNKPGSVLIYMQNGSSSKYSFVNQSVNATTEYQRFYFNNLTPAIANGADTAATLATYTGYGSGITPTVKNIQVELGTFATPFVSGSRSTTQALLDLTGSNTISINSLTYNTDNTFSFNGTSDYFSTNGDIVPVGTMTAEAWVYLNNTASDWVRVFGKGDTTNRTFGLWYNTGTNNWLYQRYGTSNIGINVSETINIGTWCHLCGVSNGANHYFYKNGILIGSATGGSTFYSASGAGNELRVGFAGFHTYHNGRIPVCRLYNRALTADEVKQNFNALRGRFGI